MVTPTIAFRPFIELSADYDTGLTAVSVSSNGTLVGQQSAGVNLAWGISGAHKWQRTQIGLDYRGGIDHYMQKTYYDSINQSLLLGVSYVVSRHSTLKARVSAGYFSRFLGLGGLQQTVPFDPSTSDIPTTDYFDNRTEYLTVQLDYTIQKSARLSFNLGGGEFLIRRRSSALSGVTGTGAVSDVQYRLTRRTTIGAQYVYNQYKFTQSLGTSDAHGAAGTLSIRLGRWLEFSGYGGFMRLESTALESVAVDPVIAALLGVGSTAQIAHSISYVPNFSGRLSRTFHKGIVYVSGGHTVTPGNGLFLTSTATQVMGGYNYTGLRRWTFGIQGARTGSATQIGTQAVYSATSGSLMLSRTLGHGANIITGYSIRNYGSPDFQNYNRLVHEGRIGIGFAPGEVPLRIW